MGSEFYFKEWFGVRVNEERKERVADRYWKKTKDNTENDSLECCLLLPCKHGKIICKICTPEIWKHSHKKVPKKIDKQFKETIRLLKTKGENSR